MLRSGRESSKESWISIAWKGGGRNSPKWRGGGGADAVFRSTGTTFVCSGQETGWKPHDLSKRPRPGGQKRKGLGRNSPAERGIIYAAEYSAWPHCKETLPDTWSCHQYISTPLPCSNIVMNLLHALLSSIWSVLHSFSPAPVFLLCPGAITAFSQSHRCPIPLAPSYPASFLPHLPFGHCCPSHPLLWESHSPWKGENHHSGLPGVKDKEAKYQRANSGKFWHLQEAEITWLMHC